MFVCIRGLYINVGIVKGAPKLSCYRLGERFEVTNNVDLIYVVDIDNAANAYDYTISLSASISSTYIAFSYMAEPKLIEKGYSLKTFLVATQVEAFLRAGGHGCHIRCDSAGLRVEDERRLLDGN